MKTPEKMAEEYANNWTEDPEYRLSYDAFLAGYQAAKDSAFIDTNSINTGTKMQWISVKDRLPETNELCIVSTEWRGIVPAIYGNESWIFDDGQGWSEKALSYATHWMPLPVPPKEEV